MRCRAPRHQRAFETQKPRATAASFLLFALFSASGCYYYAPAPGYAPNNFDRAWDAARGAAYDEGLQITSEDRSRGVINAVRGNQQVTINLRTQADGSVRVEIAARGPQGSDPGLADRVSRAYDRRMGR
jgi:hypothetical protein